jgi:hypothetical protein
VADGTCVAAQDASAAGSSETAAAAAGAPAQAVAAVTEAVQALGVEGPVPIEKRIRNLEKKLKQIENLEKL